MSADPVPTAGASTGLCRAPREPPRGGRGWSSAQRHLPRSRDLAPGSQTRGSIAGRSSLGCRRCRPRRLRLRSVQVFIQPEAGPAAPGCHTRTRRGRPSSPFTASFSRGSLSASLASSGRCRPGWCQQGDAGQAGVIRVMPAELAFMRRKY